MVIVAVRPDHVDPARGGFAGAVISNDDVQPGDLLTLDEGGLAELVEAGWREQVGVAFWDTIVVSPNATKMVHGMGKRERTLEALFANPIRANVRWDDIVALFKGLEATVEEREGSRLAIFLEARVAVFHRPHPGK